jgi:hypothetical protein
MTNPAEQLAENDAIRRALATPAFVEDLLRNGGMITIREEDGTVREVDLSQRDTIEGEQ